MVMPSSTSVAALITSAGVMAAAVSVISGSRGGNGSTDTQDRSSRKVRSQETQLEP